uniref:Uncharacterized protein n=1 Tax=Leersia perrieri TaxID=77586 RepID=A0A0D9VEK2_9ORYZ
MATIAFSRFSIYFSVLLCHGLVAQLFGPNINPWKNPCQGGFRECRFDRLQAFEPLRRVMSEDGVHLSFDVSLSLKAFWYLDTPIFLAWSTSSKDMFLSFMWLNILYILTFRERFFGVNNPRLPSDIPATFSTIFA